MTQAYRNLLFTSHAFDRLKERAISEDVIWQVVNNPIKSFTKGSSTKFIKTIHDRKIHVIAHWLAKENKWLIISVWVRGEKDKEPMMWWLITLPFKFTYWLLTRLLKRIVKYE